MLYNTFCRRLAALVLTLAVAVSAVLPGFAAYPMPVQTATETESVYLFNADTGKTHPESERRPAEICGKPDQTDDRPAAGGKRQGPER